MYYAGGMRMASTGFATSWCVPTTIPRSGIFGSIKRTHPLESPWKNLAVGLTSVSNSITFSRLFGAVQGPCSRTWGIKQRSASAAEKHDSACFQGAKLKKVILLQSGLVVAVAAIAAGWVGARGAISALIGGFAYILPNLLFVLRLSLAGRRANVMTFFAGEMFKIAATIGILAAATRVYPAHWICVLIGLFAAVKANLFAFLLKN